MGPVGAAVQLRWDGTDEHDIGAKRGQQAKKKKKRDKYMLMMLLFFLLYSLTKKIKRIR
jgi:hypothetical protein